MIKRNEKYILQNDNQNLIGYIFNNNNDKLSKLKGLDIEELLNEIEDYFLILRDNLELSYDITFGLELEFEKAIREKIDNELSNTVYKNSKNGWDLVSDTSIQTRKFGKICGGEITTPILHDTKENWIDLNKVCQMLQKLKATAENKAGGHIHFGTQILGENPTYWVNLIKLWIIYEKIIFKFSYGDKLGSRNNIIKFAPPISSKLYSILPEIKELDFKSLISEMPLERNQAINFQHIKTGNFADRNTIEFRCPNGTLNSVVWQNNVNLFAKMFLYCKDNKFDYDFIDYKLKKYSSDDCSLELYNEIYLEEALELSDLIFSNNIDKIYFLKQYLKGFNSVRKNKDNTRQIIL